MIKKSIKTRFFVPLLLLIWVFISQSLCNIDSFLYAQCGQYDSAWYFMCGKALVNGFVPYVDFSDSKGLLLWVIYGIAYLINPYSYVGVFILMCINVWVTLMILYKTCRLWYDVKQAFFIVVFASLPMFYWNFFMETKAEHFCWPYIAFFLFAQSKYLKDKYLHPSYCITIGVSLMACLLLKWSVFIMSLGFIIVFFYFALKCRKLKYSLSGFILGTLIVLIPLSLYLRNANCTQAFVNEYFVNSFNSVSIPFYETVCTYVCEWKDMLMSRRVFFLLCIFASLYRFRERESNILPLTFFCGILYVLLAIRHDNGHYLWVVFPFAIYLSIFVYEFLIRNRISKKYLTVLFIIAFSYNVYGSIRYSGEFCTRTKGFDEFMATSYAMSKVKNPKVLIFNGQERGLAMADALPATKYWSLQMGLHDRILSEQENCMLSGSADFVVIWGKNMVLKYHDSLYEIGYHILTVSPAGIVFTKHDVKMPEQVRHITPLEIITKKNYKEIYSE